MSAARCWTTIWQVVTSASRMTVCHSTCNEGMSPSNDLRPQYARPSEGGNLRRASAPHLQLHTSVVDNGLGKFVEAVNIVEEQLGYCCVYGWARPTKWAYLVRRSTTTMIVSLSRDLGCREWLDQLGWSNCFGLIVLTNSAIPNKLTDISFRSLPVNNT